jgi:hypothetical protein
LKPIHFSRSQALENASMRVLFSRLICLTDSARKLMSAINKTVADGNTTRRAILNATFYRARITPSPYLPTRRRIKYFDPAPRNGETDIGEPCRSKEAAAAPEHAMTETILASIAV